jgi:hypothetical protein
VLSKISGSLTANFLAERAEPWMPGSFFDSSALGKRYHPETVLACRRWVGIAFQRCRLFK